MADASRQPGPQVRGCLLSLRAEHGVSTSHVGQHGVRASGGVAKCHAVPLARAAAIAVARAGRKEAAKDAVLRVEHGQMLIRYGLDSIRPGAARQVGHLRGVEVVGRGQHIQTEFQQFGGCQDVCRVEAEISDQRRMRFPPQRLKQACGAHQDWTAASQQKIDDAFLAGLEYARAGDADG
jgi:hypothetical protein